MPKRVNKALRVAYSYDPGFLGASMDTIRRSAQYPHIAHNTARQGAELLGYNEYWVLEFEGKECTGGARYTLFGGEWEGRSVYIEEASA